jgi:CheY-like chemotaxis protein
MPKILVIEDEPDQNRLIKLRLEARGYTVISVGKAREGIDLAVKENPHIILMDMILPDMHGLDAAIKLKKTGETRHIPIIAISAIGSPDFIKACLQEGIVAYVRKPYDPRELFKTIEKFVKFEFPAEKKDRPVKSRPAAGASKVYDHKLMEIEHEFRKKPKKPAPEPLTKQKIDEMLQAALTKTGVADNEVIAPRDAKLGPAAGEATRAKSVLIVDDDPAFARSVCACLSKRGYEVNVGPDGVSGLKKAFEKKPDLILLNLVLPAGGGDKVLANLRKSPETAPIPVFIMSSLLSSRKLEEKARELGAQGFIAKPLEPEDLLYIIEAVVGV